VSAGWLDAPPPLASLRGGPEPARVGDVLVGTASWTDRTLLESRAFYPAVVRTSAQRLAYYARHFPVVEVDASYYALPSVRTAQAWVERTPADFVFGVKAFAALTQHPFEPMRLDKDINAALPAPLRRTRRLFARDVPPEVMDAIWERFRTGLEPLVQAGKLSYVLVQMPPWFPPGEESRAYLEEVAARLPGLPLAVEFRQAGWLDDRRREETLAFLRTRNFTYVAVDEPQGTTASVPPIAPVTTPALAVVRFHGRRIDTWRKPGATTHERFGYVYRPDELAEWVPRIRALGAGARQVLVLMNNCYREAAVQNAKDLATLLAAA
jgi:uncharacterized protein YecE (DUF72 family)